MSQSFSYDLSLSGPPAEAQARVREGVTEEMRQTAKLRLASEDADSLSFRPRWSWPLLAVLFRVIGGEGVTLNFTAADGGTQVTVAGKVGGGGEKLASRDFWTQTLGAD